MDVLRRLFSVGLGLDFTTAEPLPLSTMSGVALAFFEFELKSSSRPEAFRDASDSFRLREAEPALLRDVMLLSLFICEGNSGAFSLTLSPEKEPVLVLERNVCRGEGGIST